MISNVSYMNKAERKRFFREARGNREMTFNTRVLRVKAYARVSTEHESQQNALVGQMQWCISQIRGNWKFDATCDIYVDKGITGTSAEKRESFLQMIADAKSDTCDFDIVIVREVSRFARNVEETLKYIRELKREGIGVWFVNDNIWTFDDTTDNDFKIPFVASFAQGESRKISERSRAGQEISRKNGQPYGNGNILGYDRKPHIKNRDINPKTGAVYKTTFTYEINETQALTVRRIYELCIKGLGGKRIKAILMQEGHKTATGKSNWNESIINRILSNPTYMGYNAYGKSRVVDYLDHEVEREYDLEKLELVKGDWEPIVSEEDWYLARAERAKRRMNIKNTDESISKYGVIGANNMWIRKVQCQCGAGLRRNKWRLNKLSDEAVYGYSCYNQVNNGSKKYQEKIGVVADGACNVQNVQECKLELMAKKIFENIWKDRREAMELAMRMIMDCRVTDMTDYKQVIEKLNKQITNEEDKKMKVALKAVEGFYGQDDSFVEKMLAEIDKQIKVYKSELVRLEKIRKPEVDDKLFLKQLNDALSKEIDFTKPVISYDIVDSFVNKIICREKSEFVWVLNFNDLNNLKPIERINHLSEEYKKTLIVDDNFEIFLEFEISFEECESYMKTRGRRIVRRGWDTLKVKVALDRN